jgi:hypothetical protein
VVVAAHRFVSRDAPANPPVRCNTTAETDPVAAPGSAEAGNAGVTAYPVAAIATAETTRQIAR